MKRYIAEKVRYIHEHAPDDEHVLIVPGDRDDCIVDGRSRTYLIHSPLVSRTSRYRLLWRLEAVERILEREHPDIIESGDPYQIAWKALASGEALRIPVVGFYHSHFPEAYLRTVGRFFGNAAMEYTMDFAHRYVRHLYNRFARTLVPSPALAGVLTDWGVENTVPVDLGVNTTIFRPEPDDAKTTRDRLGIAPSQIVLLYVGRLAAEKNTRTLFETFRILHRDHPGKFHLLITGDGNQRTELQALQSAIHNSQFKFQKSTPPVTHLPYSHDNEELARLYRAADLFVHPGVQETFGLVALESQACGTPVIGIRGSYMDRIIHNDQTLWATENSPQALAQAIVETAQTDLRSTGLAASRYIHARYGWKTIFDHLFSIYREVAST